MWGGFKRVAGVSAALTQIAMPRVDWPTGR
jgi:hypothetical protein